MCDLHEMGLKLIQTREDLMQKKPWYLSKIVWLNTITFLGDVIPQAHEWLASVGVDASILLQVGVGLTVLLRLFKTSTNLTT